jgi:NodT family efflux transporter outer membrane factor (OMF) lipoprotein
MPFTLPYRLTAIASVMLLAGCASREIPAPLPLIEAPEFSAQGGHAPVDASWWSTLNDDGLNTVIERALSGNFSLAAARERLRVARALARGQSADLWPSLGLSGRGETTENLATGIAGGDSSFELGLEASYDLDLWGRLDALAEAENFRAEAEAALLQSTALSLTAEVARTWYRLAAAKEQKQVTTAQLKTNRTVLELLDARFARGQIRAADVLRQQQLVAATVEEISSVESRIAVFEHQLATLQGRPPQEAFSHDAARLVSLPPLPKVGIPAQLLRRRPDVNEALLRIRAADAEVAAAISERYPRIDISASLFTNDREDWSMFDDWLASLAGQLALPLIDGGARRAEIDRRRALLGQRVAQYGGTVLTAFREVEDALALESNQRTKLRQLETQIRLAKQTYNQLRNQYLNGVSEYIDVLDALREKQFLERELVTVKRDLIESRIALHRAIAGGILEEPLS